MTKQTLRIAFSLLLLAAPLALIGCDEPKPATPVTPATAPAAPGAPGEPKATTPGK